MKHIQLLITLVVIALLAVACGVPNSETGAPLPNATTVVRDNQLESPTVEPTEVQGEPLLSAPGIENIKVLTDIEGVGGKPLFVWEAIADAERYELIVFDEAGEPYWAWEGIKTQIYMGGTDTQPPDDSSGPSIDEGYTWTVVAYGSDDRVLAVSEVRSISP